MFLNSVFFNTIQSEKTNKMMEETMYDRRAKRKRTTKNYNLTQMKVQLTQFEDDEYVPGTPNAYGISSSGKKSRV